MTVKILATADIHSPRYLELFTRSQNTLDWEPDIIILAGDLVEKNNVHALRPIYNLLLKRFPNKPIISVYGNEEYRGYEEKYVSLYPVFKWLNDEYTIVSIGDHRIGVIGTRGALDKPTPWQSKHMPWIVSYYRSLPQKISEMVDELRRSGVDSVILVSHYGVTYKNLEGEPRRIWPYLASSRIEKIIIDKRINLVIHGHAHNAVKDVIKLEGVEIYNVALPARKRLVTIRFEVKREHVGLDKWLRR